MNTTQSVFLPGIMAVMIALSNTGAIQRCESIPFSYIIAPEENKIMYKLSLFFSATPKTNMRISCLYSEKCVQLTQKRKKHLRQLLLSFQSRQTESIFELL